MDLFQIRFYSAGVRGGLMEMEKSLTGVRDRIDILKIQTEVLTTYWEGSACRQWNRELGALLSQIELCLKGLEKLTGMVNKIAGELEETERKNEVLVDLAY